MSLALGLQNGTWQRAGGVSVHTTYITGMVTGLLTSAHEKGNTSAALGQESKANLVMSKYSIQLLPQADSKYSIQLLPQADVDAP